MSQNFPKSAFEPALQIKPLRVVLVGSLPPFGSHGARHLVRFRLMLQAAGFSADVRSLGPSALANEMSFKNERSLSRSLMDITDLKPDQAFLYAASLNFGDARQSSWWERRGEELRRLRFAFGLGTRTPRLTLVFEPLTHRMRTQLGVGIAAFFGALLSGHRVKIARRTQRLGALAPDLIPANIPAPDPVIAERSFYSQVPDLRRNTTAARLTPSLHSHALELARLGAGTATLTPFYEDLQLLGAVAKTYSAETIPFIRALRRQTNWNPLDISGPPVSSPYAIANRIAAEGSEHALPLTQFMKHVRFAHKLEKRFPLASGKDVAKYLDWYREKGPVRACGGVLPEPMPAPHARSEPIARHDPSANWGRLAHLTARDARPFPIPPQFLTSDACVPGGAFDLETPAGRIAWAFEQILNHACEGSSLGDVGHPVLDYMAAPIGGGSGTVSRFAYLMALQSRRSFRTGREFALPWHAQETRAWFNAMVLSRLPRLAVFSRDAMTLPPAPAQIDLVGLTSGKTGIAANFDMSRAVLAGTGLPVLARDAEDGYARLSMQEGDALHPMRRSVALFHLNADRVPQALVAPAFSTRSGLYNIGFLLWEFARLPKAHELALQMLDEVWVPSRFLQSAYQCSTHKPVTWVGKGLNLPDVPRRPLTDFGMRNAAKSFLISFDLHSSVERKNPLAAVRAFQLAFPNPREDVQLIIKTTPKLDRHWGDPEDQLGQIRKIARQDSRIQMLADYMPWGDFLSLIRSVDGLISPHRAEGFGYIPAYALFYGVPVVNTDYSGVQDYCTDATAYPIPYSLVDVPEDHAIYPMKGAQWADVDVDAMANALRTISEDPLPALSRAKNGQDLMRSQYSITALRRRYLTRLAEIGAIAETDLHMCS